VCAAVEIAVGARKVRNATNDSCNTTSPAAAVKKSSFATDSSNTTSPAATEKKSSFATDKWLAQCEARFTAGSEQNEVSSSQDADKLNAASNRSFAVQSDGPSRTSSNWRHSPIDAVKHSERRRHRSRSRSRSPLSSTKAAESTKTRERQLLTYVSEAKSSQRHKSYDRELPLKSALRNPSTSSTPVESYSTIRGNERNVSSSIHQYRHLVRDVDNTLSQMKKTTK